jgi:hypothetical protein
MIFVQVSPSPSTGRKDDQVQAEVLRAGTLRADPREIAEALLALLALSTTDNPT